MSAKLVKKNFEELLTNTRHGMKYDWSTLENIVFNTMAIKTREELNKLFVLYGLSSELASHYQNLMTLIGIVYSIFVSMEDLEVVDERK